MATTERTTELAQSIQHNHELLRQRSLALNEPLPSFSDGIPPGLLADAAANAARQAIINATEELQCLVRRPQEHLTNPHHVASVSLHALVDLELYRLVPATGGASYEEIARAASMQPSVVKRIFRHAMSRFIFCEYPKGVVAHNVYSRYLAESPEMRQWISMVEDEARPAANQIVHAIKKWPDGQEPRHTAYQLAHRTELTFFEFLSQDPPRAKRFADTMTWFSTGPGMGVGHLVSAYPWADVGQGKVVDVGGSFGSASLAVAESFPALSFVVQDLPSVVSQARETATHPSLSFEEHDFLQPQSVRNADVYFLRQILHDWSDKYAVDILRNIVSAMGKTSRILIMERVLPDYGAVPVTVEQTMRSFDLVMMELFNGRERDLDDFRSLFHEASPNLVLKEVYTSPGSHMDLLEVVLT